jgi:hypothetical protein
MPHGHAASQRVFFEATGPGTWSRAESLLAIISNSEIIQRRGFSRLKAEQTA